MVSKLFEGFSSRTIDFMWNLRLNNNKQWFDAHRDEFQSNFQSPMKELCREVFECLTSKNNEYSFTHKLSRIYKDARRLHGGEPYRDNLWFTIEKPSDELLSTPVFWFELAPDIWSYGLGYYQPKAETMAKFRARIDRDPKEFELLIALFEKQNEFVLDGPEYARKKIAPTDAVSGWYNKKSFSMLHIQPNGDELFSTELVERITKGMLSLIPLYDYLITLEQEVIPASKKL